MKWRLMHPDAFRLMLLLLKEQFEVYRNSKKIDNNPKETAKLAREIGEVIYSIRKEAEAMVRDRINSPRLPEAEDTP